MVYETIVDWEYKQKCTTSYDEECHGYGYHQECQKVKMSVIVYLKAEDFRYLKITVNKFQKKWRKQFPEQSVSRCRTKGVRIFP